MVNMVNDGDGQMVNDGQWLTFSRKRSITGSHGDHICQYYWVKTLVLSGTTDEHPPNEQIRFGM